MEPITVTLGGTAYDVRPFDLGQRRRLDAANARRFGAAGADVGLQSEATVNFAYDVVQIALERAKPEITSDLVEATQDEFMAAFRAILAGNRPNREQPAGEAEAPAQTAAGAISTGS